MSNLGLMHEIRIYFCFMLCLILDLFILLSISLTRSPFDIGF